MEQLSGGQWLLAITPFWLTAFIIPFLCTSLGVIYLLGTFKFKVTINVSLSGQVGDLFLSTILFIGADILHDVAEGRATLPSWVISPWYQASWGAITLAIIWALFRFKNTPWWSPHLPDRYHNTVIVGMFFYLLPSVAPVIWYAASALEWYASLACGAIFILLVLYDALDGRLDQPKFLHKFGITLVPLRK